MKMAMTPCGAPDDNIIFKIVGAQLHRRTNKLGLKLSLCDK